MQRPLISILFGKYGECAHCRPRSGPEPSRFAAGYGQNSIRPIVAQAVSAMLCAFLSNSANAQSLDEAELALAYGDKSFVSIATGSRLPVTRAPAVATVITAEDIQSIGATDLNEALETVPGLHVSRSPLFDNPIYAIRGIHTQYNPQVLMLVNGIPMTSIYLGDRGDLWGGLPVENIARIEVIRGPGSALYGAEAFSGVINIITKTMADIHGAQIGVRVGSFNSRDVWALHGGKWGPIDVAAYFRVGDTDGPKRTISSDSQTANDAALGTSASLAPGPTNHARDSIDAQLDLAHDNLRFRVGYKQRENVGSGSGAAQALDPNGSSSSKRITSDLTYHDKDFAKDWDLTLQASYFYYNERSELTLFPPGAAFLGSFPEGMIGNPSKWERHGRFTASAFYSGFKNHRVRVGAGYEKDDFYKIRESKNFTFTLIPGVGNIPTPTGAVVDVSDTAPFLRTTDREVRHLYLQDEWNIAKDWYVTAGVRHDDYSDFGGTTNPRLAVVWEAAYNLTAKLLYGRAFRAPSFVELYAINNPVAFGNPDLKPETIETIESSFAWQPSARLKLGLSLFHYKMRDILRFLPNPDPTTGSTAQNTGEQTGRGLELEAAWDATKEVRLSGNYAYQRSIDKVSGKDAGNAPHHHVYLRSDWRFAQGWVTNAQFNWIADRKRTSGDTRPDVPDYSTVDLTLRTDRRTSPWNFAFSIRNLFNADAREPSPAPGLIPNDFPLAGRSYFVEARFQL